LFQPLVENWRNDVIKNSTRVGIIITIRTAVGIKNNKTFGSYIRAIFYINCFYNFKLCGIFEKMTSFSQILKQDLGRVPLDQKFRFELAKFSYAEWNGIFHQA